MRNRKPGNVHDRAPPDASVAGTAYLALLRGINVGGKNVIKMADLKAFLETQDLTAVTSYIQSGNVLFRSGDKDLAALASRLEAALAKRFAYDSRLVLVPHKRLAEIIAKAPRGFGKDPANYRYNVFFLRPPLTGPIAMKDIPVNPDVDAAHGGRHALYHSYLIAKAGQSRISRLASLPTYQNMTIRNWNTTTKLLNLMDEL